MSRDPRSQLVPVQPFHLDLMLVIACQPRCALLWFLSWSPAKRYRRSNRDLLVLLPQNSVSLALSFSSKLTSNFSSRCGILKMSMLTITSFGMDATENIKSMITNYQWITY